MALISVVKEFNLVTALACKADISVRTSPTDTTDMFELLTIICLQISVQSAIDEAVQAYKDKDYERSEEILLKALSEYKKDDWTKGTILNNLECTYHRMGNEAKRKTFYDERMQLEGKLRPLESSSTLAKSKSVFIRTPSRQEIKPHIAELFPSKRIFTVTAIHPPPAGDRTGRDYGRNLSYFPSGGNHDEYDELAIDLHQRYDADYAGIFYAMEIEKATLIELNSDALFSMNRHNSFMTADRVVLEHTRLNRYNMSVVSVDGSTVRTIEISLIGNKRTKSIEQEQIDAELRREE